MANPSTKKNPLDYPQYVRGIRPAIADSLPLYIEDELEKVQNSMENLAVASDENTKTQISELKVTLEGADSDITARIATEETVRASQDSALATRIDTVEANLGTANAAITSEQTTRANADSALSSRIDTVSTTVDGHTASITTAQSSIDGLKVRYGVQLNANGYVTGFVQNNDGSSGEFVITADRFAIVDPAAAPGATPVVPFEVVGGVTRIKEAVIDTLTVDKLTDGTNSANMTQDGDILMGTGKIIFDNGTFMKVQGVGFGSSNQFIEWFGPKLASLASCTESNAISYLKTDGSAYFGGSLSAGTLSNSASSSSEAPNTQIALGPFGSNGGAKVLTLSYSFDISTDGNTSCPTSPNPSATVVLYKGAEGDTSTPIATMNLTGTTRCSTSASDAYFQQTISGSTTYTDNDPALTGLKYWAKLTARTNDTVSGPFPPTITQRLTIQSVEQ